MTRADLAKKLAIAEETVARLTAENISLSNDLMIWKDIAYNRYKQIQELRGELLAERTE